MPLGYVDWMPYLATADANGLVSGAALRSVLPKGILRYAHVINQTRAGSIVRVAILTDDNNTLGPLKGPDVQDHLNGGLVWTGNMPVQRGQRIQGNVWGATSGDTVQLLVGIEIDDDQGA